MKKIILLSIACLLATFMMAQRTISGTVSSDVEGPLIGATIQVKGTLIGTITDFDGNYTLEVPANVKTLVVSFIGFSTKEVTIGDSDQINISLETGELLSEIVVLDLEVLVEQNSKRQHQ